MRNASAVEKLSHHPRVTKRITDMFKSSQKCILIEGAPGIGKTVLAKEIAYCWANGEILTDMKLFLLFIRDPNLHCVESINNLVHYLNYDYLSDSEVEVAVDELRKSKGSDIILVIDGYDECPHDSKLKSFIDKLVQRIFLPMSMVVITSRPTASLSLRQLVDQRIEILGLARKERDQYISESLKGSPKMKIKLQEYLKRQPIIKSLIYVPLHLAVLLYLFKQDNLPETLTELNEYFIIHTIYRHLTKQGLEQLSCIKVTKLINFPRHILDVIYQLSKLAFKGLQDSQLVFTYDEVKEVCPEVDDTPGAINGLGLLQGAQHYCLKGAGKTTSLNFLHFTMQEYLAARYVSTLPNKYQSSLVRSTFWDRRFNYMWIMYVGIVGSQSTYLKDLFNSLQTIDNNNVLVKRYLFLFQCYLEIKEINVIPQKVISIFSDGNIDLSGQTLLPHHVMSLTVFMMRSTTQWKSLNLNACSIDCNGMDILVNFFMHFQEKSLVINHIGLRCNQLTSLWDTNFDQDHVDKRIANTSNGLLQIVRSLDLSCNQFSDSGTVEIFCALKCNKILRALNISHNSIADTIAISDCLKVNRTLNELNLSSNKITDEGVIKLTEGIGLNTTLQNLDISHNMISDNGAVAISECLKINCTLCKLNLFNNKITDEGIIRIAESLQVNTILQELNLSGNKITDEGTKKLAGAIRINTTLQELNISKNWISKEGVTRIVEACTVNRTLHKLVCTHNNLSTSGLAAINEYIRKENAVQIFDASCNSLSIKDDQLAFKTIFQLSDLQQKVQSDDDKIDEELWFIDEITDPKYLREFLQCCLDVQHVNLTGTIPDNQMLIFCHYLMNNSTLTKLKLSNNKLTDKGARRLATAIQVNTTLHKLNISMNKITDEGAKRLAEAIQINTTLQELNISKNWISKEGVMRIVEACTINRTLHNLVCTHNNLSKSGLAAINEYIRKENAVQIFDASWNSVIASSRCGSHLIVTAFQSVRWSLDSWENNLLDNKQVWLVNNLIWKNIPCRFTHDSLLELNFPRYSIISNAQDIIQGVMQVDTLQELNISGNRIFDDGANVIAEAIQLNTALQKLNISGNSISDDGAIAFNECLETNTTLIELDMSRIDITCKGASVIAKAIQLNIALQKLNISGNSISDDGAIAFSECLKTNTTLIELDMSWNIITCKGASVIAEAIQLNTALQKLNISGNCISDDGEIAFSECLKTNTTLIELNISQNHIVLKGTSVIAEAIQLNTTLQILNISNNIISDDGAIAFSKCLKTNTTLIELDTSWNNITCKGASVIAEAIQLNTALQKLNISGNSISDDEAIAFSEYLKTNTTLIELDMSENYITCKGANVIAEAIQLNTALQKLNISGNSISDDGAIAFSECLKTNTTLIELDMSKNNITCKGANVIAEAIQLNTALQKLNISGNSISDDGAIAFNECLETNTTLIELDMSRNNITCKGASVIAKAIQLNIALQKLNISGNSISNDGAIAFSECLKTNTTLIELDMSWNNITCKGASVIAEAIQLNTTLQKLNISGNRISDEAI